MANIQTHFSYLYDKMWQIHKVKKAAMFTSHLTFLTHEILIFRQVKSTAYRFKTNEKYEIAQKSQKKKMATADDNAFPFESR